MFNDLIPSIKAHSFNVVTRKFLIDLTRFHQPVKKTVITIVHGCKPQLITVTEPYLVILVCFQKCSHSWQ